MQHGHHDGNDSDGSGEYDRLGYESHQVPGRPQQLPPHQQFFQNQFGHQQQQQRHPMPPQQQQQYPQHHFQQQQRAQMGGGHYPQHNPHQGQGNFGQHHQMMPPQQPHQLPCDDYPMNNQHQHHHDMSRHSTVNEERHYIDRLRKRLDSLLSVANAIEVETANASTAWRDYQQFSRNSTRQSTRSAASMRRSSSMRSLNQPNFQDDNMSRSFDARSIDPRQMEFEQQNYRQQQQQQQHMRGGRQPQQYQHQRPPDMGGQHTYTNVNIHGEPMLDPRRPLGRQSFRGSNRRQVPEGISMPNMGRGGGRGGGGVGRGGMITQEELQQRIANQQKQNEMMKHQQAEQYKRQLYESTQLRFRMPTKSPSPLQSIGRPADFYRGHRFNLNTNALQSFLAPRMHHDHHLQQQLMHQHMMHHQNPHLHAAHFYDDQRLGTLSEPGQHFADMSDLRSEIDKAGSSKGLKGLSMSVPDLSGEHLDELDNENTFRPISPDLIDPTIAARQRAAEMEELKKQSLAFSANMAKKEEKKEPRRSKPINKYQSDSDSSDDPPAPVPKPISTKPKEAEKEDSGSVFLKSLSALRDNNLTPANENSVLAAGRLVGAMGIDSDQSGSDDDDTRNTTGKKKAVRFSVPKNEDLQKTT